MNACMHVCLYVRNGMHDVRNGIKSAYITIIMTVRLLDIYIHILCFLLVG